VLNIIASREIIADTIAEELFILRRNYRYITRPEQLRGVEGTILICGYWSACLKESEEREFRSIFQSGRFIIHRLLIQQSEFKGALKR